MPDWMPASKCNLYALEKAKLHKKAWAGPLGSVTGVLVVIFVVLFVWGMKTDFDRLSAGQDWWTWRLSWAAITLIATCFALSVNSGDKRRFARDLLIVAGLTAVTTAALPLIGATFVFLYNLIHWW